MTLTDGAWARVPGGHFDGQTFVPVATPLPEPDPDPPPPPGGRGPTGQWPAFTPAYDTPATVTTNGTVADLQAKINAATSGTVIQHAGNIPSATINGGSTSWAQNVLVRPPLGQRADYTFGSTANLQADRVTIAGYRMGGNVRVRDCARAGLAWMEARAGSSFFIDATTQDSPDLFLYEVAFIGTSSWTSVGDFGQFRGVGHDLIRPTFVGLYILGPTSTGRDGLPSASRPHNDTLQTFSTGGGGVVDAVLRDSVCFGYGDKFLQGDAACVGFIIGNTTIYEPAATSTWYGDVGDGAYGFHAITGGLSIGGAIDGCDIVGSIGSTVASITDSVGWQGSLDPAAASSSGNTVASGNPAPPVLPAAMTHAYLDTIWSA